MKIYSAAIFFLILCQAISLQATDLPAKISEARPSNAPRLSIPAFNRIDHALKVKGTVRVIVRMTALPDLPSGFLPEHALPNVLKVASQRAALARSQDKVLSRVSQQRAATAKRFHFIPFMALEVDQTEFLALASSPEIDFIEEDLLVPPALDVSVPLIGGTNGNFSGFTGAGQTVAILDTGVDKTHSFLSGKVIAEACFSTTSGISTAVCGPRGSTTPGSGLNCSSSYEGCDHGTHVAGIAAGNSTSISGVAKDAGIIAIQVFSGFPSSECVDIGSPCVMSYSSDQIAAMQHVYNLRNVYNISSVNMSLGGGAYTSYCDNEIKSEKAAIDALRSVGIATIIASGNESHIDSISFPACISSAVSVGATTKSDSIASYSNSASIINLLAPGSSIRSSVPGGTFQSWSGTSMATPHIAGAWAVLKSKRPNASVDKVLNALAGSGKPVFDSRNSIVKPRIELDAALRLIQSSPTRTDFDVDGKNDIAVWRPANGTWYFISSATGEQRCISWGVKGDTPVASDFDGDGKTDFAVWRSTNGTWHIINSTSNTQKNVTWGITGDFPVPGDYDGDSKSDIATWRPATGTWNIIDSSSGTQRSITWGVNGDTPVPGDFDGDQKTDFAIWRTSTGTWHIVGSSSGTHMNIKWGVSGDVPVPADYDGDGKTDLAVWRPSNGSWHIINSSNNTSREVNWGMNGDIPVPGDYANISKSQIAVWRPSNGTWYILNSNTTSSTSLKWGESTDIPISAGLFIQ